MIRHSAWKIGFISFIFFQIGCKKMYGVVIESESDIIKYHVSDSELSQHGFSGIIYDFDISVNDNVPMVKRFLVIDVRADGYHKDTLFLNNLVFDYDQHKFYISIEYLSKKNRFCVPNFSISDTLQKGVRYEFKCRCG